MTLDPLFSVIITAHDRKQFVSQAVRSVLSQSVQRGSIETIVVKNFRDDPIDSFLQESGCINIVTDAASLGEKLTLGIHQSSGRILSFLEDDDLFHPRRLAEVALAFKDQSLGFFHNSHQLIDSEGRALSRPFRRESPRVLRLKAGPHRIREVRALVEGGAYFNLSSTCVRREVLDPYLDFLRRVNITADNLVFYAALLSGRGLLVDTRRLTLYRLHRSASWTTGNLESTLAKERVIAEMAIVGFDVISEMLGGSALRCFPACDGLEWRVKLKLADGAKGLTRGELLALLRCRLLRHEMSFSRFAVGIMARQMGTSMSRRLYYFHSRFKRERMGLD